MSTIITWSPRESLGSPLCTCRIYVMLEVRILHPQDWSTDQAISVQRASGYELSSHSTLLPPTSHGYAVCLENLLEICQCIGLNYTLL